VFIGGCVWSWCFLRFRSIWPGYVSHVIVDVAVFAVGYLILFT
jgi:membrane protease YdiL (CAAX protease family)